MKEYIRWTIIVSLVVIGCFLIWYFNDPKSVNPEWWNYYKQN